MAKTASSPILQLIRRVCGDPRGEGSPDQELLRRFLGERDEAAFETLLRRHGPMVLDVCRGVLGNEADAEDAFQATFLILARKAESIRKAASLASFLHGVAYRIALKARDGSARRQKHEARAPQRSTTTDPDELTWREVRQVVHEELARLPERHRAALVLCYLESKTHDEAAAQLGWAKGTLRGRLQQGRALLRARLVRRGLGPGAVLVLGAWPAATETACLSPPLVLATIQAAAASVVSPHVAALTESMVKAMVFKKLKIAALLLLALAGTGTGLALTMRKPAWPEAARVVEQPVPQEKPKPAANTATKHGADRSRPIRSLLGHRDRVNSVAYAPDGRWIATAASDGTARLWDVKTGKEMRRLDAPRGWFPRIRFSPDNKFIVATVVAPKVEEAVTVWNRRTGKKVRQFPGFTFAFSPDGRLIACGGWDRDKGGWIRGIIRLYDFATGKMLRELRGHLTQVVSLAFSSDGKTLVSVGITLQGMRTGEPGEGETRFTRVWDVTTGKENRTWDLATGKGNRTVLKERECIIRTVSPDGRTLGSSGGSGGDEIMLWEAATGGRRAKLTGHTGGVWGIAFSPDGRTLASGGGDGTVRLWDLPSGKEVGRLEGHKSCVFAVAFSPDGRTLVSGGLDKKALLWDVSRVTGRRGKPAQRSSSDLQADWRDLAGDAAVGYAALRRLVSSPQRAVAFLGKQLQSARPPDAKRIARLLVDLDDERFRVREKASRELKALAEFAAPALRKALTGKPSLEVQRQLKRLLHRLEGGSLSAETLRHIRAVEALEAIGNPQARRLVDKLAAGPAEMRLTQEAKAAAGRLAKRAVLAR
jgi:RNA polymerase sigma factor (sigma-70 family)